MATVCGGSLALMDAGVPMKAACAGIAMGLVIEGGNAAVLTDIAGAEDHYGDMDFKVAGTRQGITALQMDIKVGGVSIPLMRQALEQAKRARFHILDIMEQTITEARKEMSQYAPRLFMLMIPTDKIRDLIGPGGKKIRSIIEATGVKIDVMDDGKVHIFANSGAAGDAALQMVRDVTASAEIGKTYLGKVVRLAEFGAFVEIFPGTDGLLHVSEIAETRIKDVRWPSRATRFAFHARLCCERRARNRRAKRAEAVNRGRHRWRSRRFVRLNSNFKRITSAGGAVNKWPGEFIRWAMCVFQR
jgi:polyribonucleotide nucleotidyltransferase